MVVSVPFNEAYHYTDWMLTARSVPIKIPLVVCSKVLSVPANDAYHYMDCMMTMRMLSTMLTAAWTV